MSHRKGVTLLEVLVVLFVIAILLGLLMVAVQRVRQVAIRTESTNNLRQIVLGTQSFASNFGGRLPSVDGDRRSVNRGVSLFGAILPFVEADNSGPFVKIFLSPADPTLEDKKDLLASASYCANAQAFQGNPSLQSTFLDGTSNTIAFAEHYARCGNNEFDYLTSQVAFAFIPHRATFADGGNVCSGLNYGDIYPVTAGSPPVSAGDVDDPSGESLTFQVAPLPAKCACGVAQTPHSSGMLSAMADGSVRTLAPHIAPSIYWGAVTPNKGEIVDAW